MRTKKGEKQNYGALILDRAVAYLKSTAQRRRDCSDDEARGLTRGRSTAILNQRRTSSPKHLPDLARLERRSAKRFREDGAHARKKDIEYHLSGATYGCQGRLRLHLA